MHSLQFLDPECVDGVPLTFDRLFQLEREIEFDDALADGFVPPHELEQHKPCAA